MINISNPNADVPASLFYYFFYGAFMNLYGSSRVGMASRPFEFDVSRMPPAEKSLEVKVFRPALSYTVVIYQNETCRQLTYAAMWFSSLVFHCLYWWRTPCSWHINTSSNLTICLPSLLRLRALKCLCALCWVWLSSRSTRSENWPVLRKVWIMWMLFADT